MMIRPWHLVAIFLSFYLAVIWLGNERDSQVFVTLGSCFAQCEGVESCPIPKDASAKEQLALEGYDGQFNYYIARDPAQAAPCIDVPAYRYQRIGLPALALLLSFGQEKPLPWLFILINSLALILSTFWLEELLVSLGRKRWFALSYGLFFGVVVAVRLSTSEPLAYALVIAALWRVQKKDQWTYPILLALAALSKETTLLIVAGFGLWFLQQRAWRELLRVMLIVLGPFILWQLYLYHWLGSFGVGSGGAMATSFEIIPFAGFLKIGTEGGLAVFVLYGLVFMGFFILLPTFWALAATLRGLLQKRELSLYGYLLLVSALIIPFVPFSTYREFLGMYRFCVGLVLLVVLYSAEQNARRPLMYSTLWIILLLFLQIG